MEEQQNKSNNLNNLNNNFWFKFWNNVFNFMNNRTTLISCSSLFSLIIILVVVLMMWNQIPDLTAPTNNIGKGSIFSTRPYDLAEL